MKEILFFDPAYDLEIYHGDLPHWRQEGAVYFVTFRLADSLPQAKLRKLISDRANWLKLNKHKKKHEFTGEDWKIYNYLFHERSEKWLEAGYGSCILKRDDCLSEVVNAFLHFDGIRYDLDSYVIMPNHVHLIVTPINGYTLAQITHSWKSYTANTINRIMNQSGQLWRHESYDHIIRNEEALDAIRNYIKLNPVKARINLHPSALYFSEASNVPEVSTISEASLLRNNNSEAVSFGNHAGSFGRTLLTCLMVIFCTFLSYGQNTGNSEKPYQFWLNDNHFHGEMEYPVPNGRVDIVNKDYAIEVEFAHKWKHSIGQALWYGLQTNKKPGIVLILKDKKERKYGIMLQSALDYAGISDKIKVWFYPEDFGKPFGFVPTTTGSGGQSPMQGSPGTTYSINKNSKVRHNSGCAHFACKNCVAAGANDGRACKHCGG